jgi:hypothetical protein
MQLGVKAGVAILRELELHLISRPLYKLSYQENSKLKTLQVIVWAGRFG